MSTTTITASDDVLTLINVFIVKPEHQDELVRLLTQATDEVMVDIPGFVSANIHRSADGKRVVNYAQWRSRADFDAMQANEEARPHMAEAAAIATSFDPIICEVTDIRHA